MGMAMQIIHEIIQGAMETKPKVALDTCCVQYYISNPPIQPWADCLDPVFRAGLDGKIELYISAVVVSELLADLYFTSRQPDYDPELDLLAILNRHFQMLDVNGEVARAAGRLRGNHAPGDKMVLKTPDALIGATSLVNGHTLFITNDAELARALPDENCIYLKELALDWLDQNFPATCVDVARTVSPTYSEMSLFPNSTIATPELGSIRPDPSADWRRILADAFTVATMLNEPCVFFLLMRGEGSRTETVEVISWHEGLENVRRPDAMIGRIENHLGYSRRTGRANNSNHYACAFCFTSLKREHIRQSQACYASKSDHQKEVDAWDGYLGILWRFRSALNLPQITWLLCEDTMARYLKPHETLQFLEQAKNIFGWESK